MTRTAVATDDHGHNVRTVVVADSDDDILDLLIIILEGMDVACHRAEDGGHAVALCREHKPEVLLLDAVVHGMTAPDVCRAIRADQALAGVRVILLAARADRGCVEEALASGAETVIIKPVSPIELTEVFRGRRDGPW
jgi:CheY-like chemotaxis protein